MKSESEIRRHRDNVRDCMMMPCGCRGTLHQEACFRGLMMMRSTVETLSWILGENDELNDLVNRMDQDATEFRKQPTE